MKARWLFPPCALLAYAALATPALADPRIATRLFAPSQVVTLHGQMGIESTIAFGDDERIENVAVGDSEAWQVTPNKRANLLFVKPLTARARTNMTVVTDQHTYLFDLATTHAAPVYMLRFTYPAKPRPIEPVHLAATPAPAPAVTAVPKPVLSPAALDFDWARKGDARLLPDRAFDDGRAVYLQWGKDATLPAILTREPNGVEGPVNYTVRGDYIVVEGVPSQLILRDGKQMATLTIDPAHARAIANANPSPVIAGLPPGAPLPQTASAQP